MWTFIAWLVYCDAKWSLELSQDYQPLTQSARTDFEPEGCALHHVSWSADSGYWQALMFHEGSLAPHGSIDRN